MQKIVVNKCYGGFGLSEIAEILYLKLSGNSRKSRPLIIFLDIPRDDPNLIKVVEDLGDEANTSFSKLHIIEIPDGVEWEIEECDGKEWVAERHRVWY